MKQISKNFIWNVIGNTAYNGLQWLITVIVARKAGFDNAGILSIAMSLSLTFRTISYFGIRNFQISDESNKYSSTDYTGFRIITCTASLVLCMIFAILSGYDKAVISAICWYMLFRVSEGFSDLLQGVMQKKERLDTVGICLTVKAVITTAAFISVFYSTASMNYALCAMAVSALIVTFLIELPLTEKICVFKTTVEWKNCRKLAIETTPLLVHLLLISVTLNMPKYVLSLSYDEAYLGAYSSIFSVSQIIQAVFQYMYTPFLTEFSRLYSNDRIQEIKKLAVNIFFVFVILLALFVVIMQLLGTTMLTLIFGKEIEQYKFMILPAIISVCAYCTMVFVCTLETIMRKFRVMIMGQLVGVTSGIVCTLLFMKILGANGVSYGMAVGALFASVIMIHYTK